MNGSDSLLSFPLASLVSGRLKKKKKKALPILCFTIAVYFEKWNEKFAFFSSLSHHQYNSSCFKGQDCRTFAQVNIYLCGISIFPLEILLRRNSGSFFHHCPFMKAAVLSVLHVLLLIMKDSMRMAFSILFLFRGELLIKICQLGVITHIC